MARGVPTLAARTMICPSCKQDAPTVIRGMRPYCTACGAPRPLMAATDAVNLAGQPAKVGGEVARGAGYVALFGGAVLALVLGGVFQALFHTGLLVAVPVALAALLVSLPLLLGGRKLRRSGDETARSAHEQAVIALAARVGGVVTAREAASRLSLTEEQADALLTEMAKRPDGKVTLEVDDAGVLSFHFRDLLAARRVRIEDPPPRPRVVASVPPPRVIDAELIEEEDAAAPEARARRTVR